VKFHSPPIQGGDPQVPSNTPGIRHLAFLVEDIDAMITNLEASGTELVAKLVRYETSYRLCYVRGPEGIIVELAEKIGRRPATGGRHLPGGVAASLGGAGRWTLGLRCRSEPAALIGDPTRRRRIGARRSGLTIGKRNRRQLKAVAERPADAGDGLQGQVGPAAAKDATDVALISA
jgi:glyoxalase/bleomycin resistance protein/dioxygenase superfamily protein